MGERLLYAFALDGRALARVVGSRDPGVLSKALALESVVRDLDAGYAFAEPPTSTAKLLKQVLDGQLERSYALEYRRLLEALGEVVGSRLFPRLVVTPGYGLARFGSILPHWGMPTLGKIWARNDVCFPFARAFEPDPWPKLMMIRGPELPAVRAEVQAFDGRSVPRDLTGNEAADAFLTEPGQLLADPLDPHVEHVLGAIAIWAGAAERDAGRSLLMLMDGDQ